MLDSIDTLIAFTLIMLVVSLLITVAVQMIASTLNLRGLNLVKGLAETFNTISPGLMANLGGQARQLASHILTGPLLSDSSFKLFPKFWRFASAVRPDEIF